MHARLAAALLATVVTLTAAPALADDEPTPVPTADTTIVQTVETALAEARTATPASKRNACLARAASTAAQARFTKGTWTDNAQKIATSCKVLKVVAVKDFSASNADDIAHRLITSDPVDPTLTNRFTSQHAVASYRQSADKQSATILLVAEPRHRASFAPAATRSINAAFVKARSAKPSLKHSSCLSSAAHSWSKELVATAGATAGRQKATQKKCGMRVVGVTLINSRGTTAQVTAAAKKSPVFRSFAGRRTPVRFATAVYVDDISGVKRVVFLAAQPK